MVVSSFLDSLLLQVSNVALQKITVMCMVTRYLDLSIRWNYQQQQSLGSSDSFFCAKVVRFVLWTFDQIVEHA